MWDAEPFANTPNVPPGLRIPAWLAALTVAAIAAGIALGALTGVGVGRSVRATFFGAGFAYLTTSLVDFWEHFRLENQVTGRYLAASAIPVGETVNHGLTILTLTGMFILARPLPPVLEPRDWFIIFAPAVFLTLGWRDELVYHRRRAKHREDIMHTVSHLAAGVMLSSFYVMRLALR